MVQKLTVLVAGSTGMLGSKIVTALLNKGDTNVGSSKYVAID